MAAEAQERRQRARAAPRPLLSDAPRAEGRSDEISRDFRAASAGDQHGGHPAAAEAGALPLHVGAIPQGPAPAHPQPPAPPPAPAPALGRPEAPAAAAAASPGGRRGLAGGQLPGVALGGCPEAQDRGAQPGP